MVNIESVIYIDSNQEVHYFNTIGEYKQWRIDSCTDPAQKTRMRDRYAIINWTTERRLERMFNLEPNVARNIMHLFVNAAKAERYLSDVNFLNAIQQEDHFMVIELRPSKSYNVATVYLRERHFSVIIDNSLSAVGVGSARELFRPTGAVNRS